MAKSLKILKKDDSRGKWVLFCNSLPNNEPDFRPAIATFASNMDGAATVRIGIKLKLGARVMKITRLVFPAAAAGAVSTVAAITLSVTVASAADMTVKALKAAPAPVSLWEVEIGVRYFYSSGRTRYTLGDPFVPGQINSQLTYKNIDSHAGEAFGRIDHVSGLFAKGFAGAGNIFKGTLIDEDYPPAIFPYSATSSAINNGKLWYGTVDVGYAFWKGPTYKVGAFVGYNHFYETANGYGCTQIAANPAICGVPIPTSILVLSKTENWDSLRVGLNGVFNLAPQWRLTLDGAYLPYVKLSGHDNHWLRPDINPLPQAGRGWGYQVEGVIAYDVTPNFSLGVGGRYWYAKTNDGTTQFPGFPPSPTTFSYERYGGFLQASYKFGQPSAVVAKY